MSTNTGECELKLLKAKVKLLEGIMSNESQIDYFIKREAGKLFNIVYEKQFNNDGKRELTVAEYDKIYAFFKCLKDDQMYSYPDGGYDTLRLYYNDLAIQKDILKQL